MAKRQPHHTLARGTLVSIGDLKGRIRGYSLDRVVATDPTRQGEWYFVQIYADPSGLYWKCERKYLVVR